MITTDDLIKIVSYGGGVIVDSSITTGDLVKIASYSKSKGCKVIVKNAGRKTTDDLVRIASYGDGNVIFDFTE